MRPARALFLSLALLVTTAPGCHAFGGARFPRDCQLGDARPAAATKRTPVDLSPLKIFRSAFAVDAVGPYEQHFTIWSQGIEPEFAEVRARKDHATGRLHIEVDGGMWGGIGAPPAHPTPAPPDVADLERELESEARTRCPDTRDWVFQYQGAYRTVQLEEMMPVKVDGTTTRIGWNGHVVLTANADLTNLTSAFTDYESGFGLIELTSPLQWVDYLEPPEAAGRSLLIDAFRDPKASSTVASHGTNRQDAESAKDLWDPKLVDAALDAARRLDGVKTGPMIAEIAQKQGDSLLPAGIDQTLHAQLSFYARPRKGIPFDRQQQIVVPVAIRMSQAAYGPAEGTREGIIGGSHFKATATLTPRTPLAKDLPAGPQKFAGTLHLVVTDDHGPTFDRSYPASGDLLVEGHTVVSPAGLSIPGSSGPSAEMDALHTTFPGQGDFESIDMYITAALEWDPRD